MTMRDTMRRWNTRQAWERRGLGLLALALAVPMAWHYFVRFETSGHFQRDGPAFYRDAWRNARDWYTQAPHEVAAMLRTGRMGEFESYALGAAMARWRVRGQAPALWDRLMQDYARGWWRAPSREEWERLFTEADAAWLAARRRALEAEDDATRRARVIVSHPRPDMTRVAFREGSTSAQVGTLLRLVYDDDEGVPEYRIWGWWCINQHAVLGYRQRQGIVYTSGGAPAGRVRRVHEWDMAWEPAWTAVEAHPFWIELRARLDPGRIVSIEMLDSPLLDPAAP